MHFVFVISKIIWILKESNDMKIILKNTDSRQVLKKIFERNWFVVQWLLKIVKYPKRLKSEVKKQVVENLESSKP